MSKATEKKLFLLGARDSKELTRAKREELYEKMKQDSGITIVTYSISAQEIDQRATGSLNKIQTKSTIKLLNEIVYGNPQLSNSPKQTDIEEIYIDALESGSKYSQQYFDIFKDIKVICENKADAKFPVVSCASIVAKVQRDALVKQIEKDLGEKLGNGYPSDPYTIAFLKKCSETKNFPSVVRSSWATVLKLKGKS